MRITEINKFVGSCLGLIDKRRLQTARDHASTGFPLLERHGCVGTGALVDRNIGTRSSKITTIICKDTQLLHHNKGTFTHKIRVIKNF